MIPWFYNLPSDQPKYNEAWRHVLDTTQLLGEFGLRTNEPSYEYYFKQFVFTMVSREANGTARVGHTKQVRSLPEWPTC